MNTVEGLSGGSDAIEVFRQAPGGGAQGIGAAIGAVLFLGIATLFLVGVIPADLPIRIVAALGFGFFGLLMGAGAVAGATRGGDGRVAAVDARGLWLPEMGRLAWGDVAEVRLERVGGVGSSRAPITRQFRRLGVFPRDPSLRPPAAAALATRLTSAYFRLVRMIAPDVRLGGDEPAPFGVSEAELPKDFERLLDAVRRHTEVVDAAEVRARRVAGRWSAGGSGEAPAQPTPTDLGGIVAAASQVEPRGSFAAPAVRPLELAFSIIPTLVLPAILVPAVLPLLAQGGSGALFSLAILGFFGVLFVLPAALRLIRLARQMRERRDDAIRLRIGPEGIWTTSGGLVAWPNVREVRTERAGSVRRGGSPPIERWRLVIATATGRTAGVASDELDARFDDVVDLVRYYHPVVESS